MKLHVIIDLGPLDLNQMHVINSLMSISLVRTNGKDIISRSANQGVTRGDLWML